MLLAAMLLCGMSACGSASSGGDDPSSLAAEQTTAATETTTSAAETETTAPDSTEPAADLPETTAPPQTDSTEPTVTNPAVTGIREGTPADADAAKAVLESFLLACTNGNHTEMERLSDLPLYLDLTKSQSALSEEEAEQNYAELLDSLSELKSYTIGEGKMRPDYLRIYLGEMNGDSADFDDLEGEERAAAEAFLQKLPMPDMLCVIPVTTAESGETPSEQGMYLIHTAEGWQVDLVMMPTIFGFSLRLRYSGANTAAKSAYNAVNAALTDLDADGVDVAGLLSGDFKLKGSEFEGVTAPDAAVNRDTARKMLMAKIRYYYADITALDELSFSVSGGSCTALAVQSGTLGDLPLYGAYPRQFSQDDLGTVQSIEAALAYAKQTE